MEKIKITKEQEEIIFKWKEEFEQKYETSQDLSTDEISSILAGFPYEVKQSFEVGDWVYNKYVDGYRKIVVDTVCHENEVSLGFVLRNKDRYEKVTEPWKIELLESGREKPELQIGDVYVDINGVACLIEGDDFLNSTVLYELASGLITKIFPAERGIEVKG